jgi:hypothetical protein
VTAFAKTFGLMVGGFVLMVGALSACGAQSPSEEGGTSGNYEYVTVDTPHGPVDCIIWDGTRAGNITCDWDNE